MPANLLQTLTKHSDRVWTLAWNPNGNVLASSGSDKKICLWSKEANDWNCVAILDNSHEKSIRRICWSPCGQYIASASFDSTVCIWKKNPNDHSWGHHFLMTLEGHESEVKSVAWSSDGQFLASCGRDRTIWIWERASDIDPDSEDAENWDCSDVKIDHTKDVKHIVWHPKFNILASCSYDDTIKLFHKDGQDWKCYETLSSHTSTVWSADFSASGEFFVTCSDDRTVRIWKNRNHTKLPLVEPNSWKCVSVIQGYHSRTIYDVSWSDSDVIVSASGDNSLSFYAKSNEIQPESQDSELFVCIERHCQSHECDVNVVAWNPKVPGLLASGSDDRSVKLWNYSLPKGMTSLRNITDEILNNLKATSLDAESSISAISPVADDTACNLTFNITDFSTLLNLIQSFQNLQNEVNQDKQLSDLELMFDLKLEDWNKKPVGLSNLTFNETDGFVDGFIISIVDCNGDIKYIFRVVIDRARFCLSLPRRSIKLMVVAGELFLLEKTGDMYKILFSGKSQFLLGHLFTFSDVQFMMDDRRSDIRYVISSDRDEKIRVTKYPETYEIERFCFGHKSTIVKLVLVDDKRFISIDQEKIVMLWNLSDLGQDNKPIKPERTESLSRSVYKRIKT